MRRALMAWSSGKDSAYALGRLRDTHDVVGLVTLFSEHDRVFMHAVTPDLVASQARAANVPLRRLDLPAACSHEDYERLWQDMLVRERDEHGVEAIAFGDLFLPDVRSGRERLAERAGIAAVFPIWREDRDTRAVAAEMVAAGVSAIITCGDPEVLPRCHVGRRWEELVAEAPAGIDPCGEFGELHTFATACPAFAAPVSVHVAGVVERGGFVFADVRPA